MLRLLDAHQVRYVLTGSVAAMAWGAEAHPLSSPPGDLDIVPELTRENLTRLAALLEEIEASVAALGDWIVDDRGERTWVDRHATAEELAAWKPDPGHPASFDHHFHTRVGNVDVVPALCGRYDELMTRARFMQLGQWAVPVAHIDDLLAGLTVPRREKDRARVDALRRMQRACDDPTFRNR